MFLSPFSPNPPTDPLIHKPVAAAPPAAFTSSFLPAPQQKPQASGSRVKSFALSGGLFTAAILLKRFPARTSAYQLIPTDWKQWAKAGLGIAGINQLNQGLNWNPPLWLGTLQTVSILTPLLQKLEKGWPRQFFLLAPLITGLVQANHWLSEKAEGPLERKFNIPPFITQLGFSIATTILGMKTFPLLDKGTEGLFNRQKTLTKQAQPAAQSTTVATGITCARGCCASTVCLNEIGEYGSAFGNWIRQKNEPDHTMERKQG
jgi:hypothetical protein